MTKKLWAALLALSPMLGFAQTNIVDEIIWVVGNEPILLSDVEETRISSEAYGQPVDNPYCTIPEQIAVNKLFVHQAELDSVTVSESDVIRAVDNRINESIQAFGSREALEQMYGRSVSQMRENLKKQYREQMMADEVRQKLTTDVKATPAEVREYFKNVPNDSLPFIQRRLRCKLSPRCPKCLVLRWNASKTNCANMHAASTAARRTFRPLPNSTPKMALHAMAANWDIWDATSSCLNLPTWLLHLTTPKRCRK